MSKKSSWAFKGWCSMPMDGWPTEYRKQHDYVQFVSGRSMQPSALLTFSV